MLITNGTKIVTIDNNLQALEEASKKLKSRAKDVLSDPKAKFPVKEDPYPHIENTSGYSFAELKQLCMPDIQISFRAIGPERIQLPDKKLKDIKHIYSPDEKTTIAEQFCDLKSQQEAKENEKKTSVKKMTQEIEQLDVQISELAKLHRQGYEIKTKDCHLHLDFENKQRVYTDIDTGDVLHTEDLDSTDYQMKIEFNGDAYKDNDGNALTEQNITPIDFENIGNDGNGGEDDLGEE